jgi:hypothetical protein
VCQIQVGRFSCIGECWPGSSEVVGSIRRRDATRLSSFFELQIQVRTLQMVFFARSFLSGDTNALAGLKFQRSEMLHIRFCNEAILSTLFLWLNIFWETFWKKSSCRFHTFFIKKIFKGQNQHKNLQHHEWIFEHFIEFF